jgi:hypothetical protein
MSYSKPETHAEHKGGFAEGQDDPEEYPEDRDVGSFAEGQDDPKKYAENRDRGSFAEGEEQ